MTHSVPKLYLHISEPQAFNNNEDSTLNTNPNSNSAKCYKLKMPTPSFEGLHTFVQFRVISCVTTAINKAKSKRYNDPVPIRLIHDTKTYHSTTEFKPRVSCITAVSSSQHSVLLSDKHNHFTLHVFGILTAIMHH